MNNEINKSHEDILKRINDENYVKNIFTKANALRAMAEVAGLREKEVEGLKEEIEWLKRKKETITTLSLNTSKRQREQLAAKYKEIERLERVIRKMDADAVANEKEIEQLKAELDLVNRIATESKKPNI